MARPDVMDATADSKFKGVGVVSGLATISITADAAVENTELIQAVAA